MRSAVEELFYRKWSVEVEERAFHSAEEIEEYGIWGVNSIEEAENYLSSYRKVFVTLADIAEFFSRGISIRLMNKNDVHEMYRIVTEHMQMWLNVCNRAGFVATIPPIEDFEKLDEVAKKLHPLADKRTTLSKWSNNLSSLFKAPAVTENNLVYVPYAPKLFPYCAMVHGGD